MRAEDGAPGFEEGLDLGYLPRSSLRTRDDGLPVPPLAFMDDLERIPVRVEYISGIVSRIVFQSCAG